MDFRVYIVLEIPILEQKYELLVPIDRKIIDLINLLRKNIPELNQGYYSNNLANLYNKSTGMLYDMNTTIKDCNIKVGTRIVMI